MKTYIYLKNQQEAKWFFKMHITFFQTLSRVRQHRFFIIWPGCAINALTFLPNVFVIFLAAALVTTRLCSKVTMAHFELHPDLNPWHLIASCVYTTQHKGLSLPCADFYFTAILFLTPYSINVVIIIFIITHQQKVTEFEEWICKCFFFFFCPQYEGSVNKVLFFCN